MRRASAPIDTGPCPGGCGRQVPRTKLACSEDWWRLPPEIRYEVNINYRRNRSRHLMAVRDAIRWYQANPRDADDVV